MFCKGLFAQLLYLNAWSKFNTVFRRETWVPVLFPNLITAALASVVWMKRNSGGLSQSRMRQFGAAVSPSDSSLPGRKNCSMSPRRICFPTHWTRPQPLSLPMALLVSQRPAHSQCSCVEDRSDPCISQCFSSWLGRGTGKDLRHLAGSLAKFTSVDLPQASSMFHLPSSLLFT